MTFTKRGSKNYVNMYLDGSLIEKTKSHKHLGFILDENLNFKDHVLNLSKKIQKQLNPLKYLSKTVKSYHLNAIYQGFIRPHFDYGDILYSANKTVLEQLERTYTLPCGDNRVGVHSWFQYEKGAKNIKLEVTSR